MGEYDSIALSILSPNQVPFLDPIGLKSHAIYSEVKHKEGNQADVQIHMLKKKKKQRHDSKRKKD